MMLKAGWRKTSQLLAPAEAVQTPPGQYNPYPGFPLGGGKINAGYGALARALREHPTVILDGFGGVFWEHLRDRLEGELSAAGVKTAWTNAAAALKQEPAIEAMAAPYLGGSDPLFGTRFQGELSDFFDPAALAALRPDPHADLNILYGCGAALAGWQGCLVYFDVPKNEIQFRSRAGSITNLGVSQPASPKVMYKRFYFVDWVALNHHKAGLLPRIDFIVDEQRPDEPVFMTGSDLRAGLKLMAGNYFRVRPWFEPGPWGGQWIKAHILQLAQEVPNYAWSFELIVPENGLVFESGGRLLEVSFDLLMAQEYQAVLGDCAPNFGYEFPIRYDFLDTFSGGNLSVQCHPRPEYVRRHFGETFTQDECYYILDCKPGARVYLGFQEGTDPQEFRQQLEGSARSAAPVEIDRFVNPLPVQKHDFLLIPNGTIHGAGKDNLVLEISATPYIFTFKMYDWLRLDLDGKPRSLNIGRAFENLYFERQGQRARQELISRACLQAEDEGWRIVHCPTHPNHFYDVHRLEFNRTVEVGMDGSCHVLSLVEGKTVLLETANGLRQRFNYAETFVIPASAGSYRLTSEAGEWIKVIKTFVKPASEWAPGVVPFNIPTA